MFFAESRKIGVGKAEKSEMIPKILHWCWYGGGERPASVRRTMASWRRVGEGWEERLWSEETATCPSTNTSAARRRPVDGRW